MDQEEIKQPSLAKNTKLFSDRGYKYIRAQYPTIAKKTYQLLLRIFAQVASHNVSEWYEKEKLKEEAYSKPLYHENPKNMYEGLLKLVPQRLDIKEDEIQTILKWSQHEIKKKVAIQYAKQAKKEEDGTGQASIVKGKQTEVKSENLKKKIVESSESQDDSDDDYDEDGDSDIDEEESSEEGSDEE